MDLNFFFKYFIRIYKKIINLFKIYNALPYQHQIINEAYVADEKTTIFTVKSQGMNIFPRYLARELACDDEILKNFHPSDIKRIMKAYFSDNETYVIENIKYKITSKTCRQGKALFTINSEMYNYSKKMTASEIINNKEILFYLSKEDISDVCYDAGMESTSHFIDSINSYKSICNLIHLVPNEIAKNDKPK